MLRLVVHLSSDDLNNVLQKIKKLNASAGPFEYVFLLGAFQPLSDTSYGPDLPEIISISSIKETWKNTTNPKGYGVLNLAERLQVGYIALNDKMLMESAGGVLDKFNNVDHGIDILITNAWSVALSERNDVVTGSKVIDQVCEKLRPKYHFTFGDASKFFELEPFAWPDSTRTTRFINVAAFQSKKKWAYAFQIDLTDNSEKPETSLANNVIQNPYLANSRKRDAEERVDEPTTSNSKRMKSVLPSNCHFCFTNPNIEDHMFVSISNHAYLATAKGPLSVPSGDMNFSGHCLIIPIKHVPKLNMGQGDFFNCESRKELLSYESSVVKMNDRKFDMSTVVFEIHSDRSIHFHKQIVPVPKYLIMRFKDALDRQLYLNNERYKNNAKMDFQVFNSGKDSTYRDIIGNPKENFIQFTVYESSQSEPVIYLSRFSVDERLDLQFGRRVLAFLMRLPKRVNWASTVCKQTTEQEMEDVKKFQKGYGEFDIAN